jgi:acetolactate synthase-1/2/3 large subunit
MPTVGQFIVETLVAHGIDRVFVVPGESYLGLLDALHGRSDIDTVVCRHESGAGFMALADARLTGRPGVACVSRGPGASNAAIAVHTAQQDGVPFLLLVGQVAAADLRRDSFQEIDYGRMFGGIAKWTAEVSDPARIGEVLLRALKIAQSGLPGPVVVALAEDVLTAATAATPVLPQALPRSAPHPDDIDRLRDWLERAERPLVVAGSGLEPAGGRAALHRFVETWNLPLTVSFRRQDLFPNAHQLYVGDLGLANPPAQMAAFQEADLLVVLGARLSDITTQGYTFPHLVRPQMRLAHIHADPAQIGLHFAADIAIACQPAETLAALGPPRQPPAAARASWLRRLAAERQAIAAPRRWEVTDGIAFETVVEWIGRNLPPDAIVTADAGSFAAPIYRIVPFTPPQRLLAPISGAMGFGVPAAVAAALREPRRPVVCFVGDGGLLMTGNELAVAQERGLPLKVIVAENRLYGSIWIHQQRQYPGRATGTGFANPDLGLIGKAFGCAVTHARATADLPALADALACSGAAFVVVSSSVQAITPAGVGQAASAAAAVRRVE